MKNQGLKNYRNLFFLIFWTAVVFSPVLKGSYLLNWDDNQQILENLDVKFLSWHALQNFFTTFYVRSYQPLASLSFSVEYWFFGENPFVPHAVNYLIHLVNVFLVFQFLQELFLNQKRMNFFVTSIFALNPIQTETIAWISTRSTLMFSAFYLISCWRYVVFIRENRKIELLFCLISFVLALFCKSAALTLPLVVFLIDLVMKRPISRVVVMEKIPFFSLSIIFGLIGMAAKQVRLGQGSEFDFYYSRFERLCLMSYSYLFYIWKAVFPFPLYNYYEYPLKIKQSTLSYEYPLSFLLVLFVLVLIVVFRKKLASLCSREAVFGFLFFSANIFLVLSFFSFSPNLVAERYDYLAIIGLAIFFYSTFSLNFRYRNFLCGVILVVYSVLSVQQARVWENQETLWGHTIQYSKGTYPFIQLAQEHRRRNDLQGALLYFNEAVKINPYDPQVYSKRGFLILDLGDFAYAQKDFGRMIDSSHGSPIERAQAFYGRAKADLQLNQIEMATQDIDSAIQLNPQFEYFQFKGAIPGKSIHSQEKPLNSNATLDLVLEKILTVAKDEFEKKNYQRVVEQCETYFDLGGKSEEAHRLLGRSYEVLHLKSQTQRIKVK